MKTATNHIGATVAHNADWMTGPTGVVIDQVGMAIHVRWAWGYSWTWAEDVTVISS